MNNHYDIAIIGGGLAGLAAALECRAAGYSVVVVEKNGYPAHKVCGEYIGMESRNFLMQHGIAVDSLPQIHQLLLTAPNGKSFSTPLTTGGFGISRYRLDHELCEEARNKSVVVMEHTRVQNVSFTDQFHLQAESKTSGALELQATVCLSAHGKKSNLDIVLKRDFLSKQNKRLDNYIGIKYHVRTDWPEGVIGLHNFDQGYCGISAIEDGLRCLCYMTTAHQLKASNNSIPLLQEKILGRNPHLQKIFANSSFAEGFPVTISQITFQEKERVLNHMLMMGDAAGMITPLCGNGMSIALHTGKLAASAAVAFLQKKITREQMEAEYSRQWNARFDARLRMGRQLQSWFGTERKSNLFVSALRALPFLAAPIIRRTHGESF